MANALQDLNQLLGTTRQFLDKNSEVLTHDIDNLANTTNAILQPDSLNGLETALHVFPTLGANLMNIVSPVTGGVMGIPVINNFANPIQFVCSAIQAGSRLGYQESAEMCAQYLAPILDAIKFNFPPFGLNQFTSAMTLPKQIAYSEPRLQPPAGYKDTTVPGIWSRDTLFSHGNHEQGWVTAPGMQGIDVQPFTANMLFAGVAGRTDGRARRADPAGAADLRWPAPGRPAGRLHREQPAAAAVVPAAGTAARPRARRDSG